MRIPKDWAIFTMKDGSIKRLCVGLYTAKTAVKIFDDIIMRCAMVGNILDVPSGIELVNKKRKRKNRSA